MKILDVVYLSQVKEEHLVRWHSRTHAHPYPQFEFHCFVEGRGTFLNGTTVYPVRKDRIFLSAPDQVHEIRVDDPEHWVSYYAVLFEVGPEDPVLPLLTDQRFQETFPVPSKLSQRVFFEDVKNKFSLQGSWYRTRAAELGLEALILDLYGDYFLVEDRIESGETFNFHLDQAIGILRNTVYSQLTLHDLCGQLKITPEYLIRLFGKHLQTTPMRYFSNLKIEAATSLLINSDLSIKEISFKLGYSNQQHFSKNFRKHTGSSPSAFRTNYFLSNPTEYHMKLLPDQSGRGPRR